MPIYKLKSKLLYIKIKVNKDLPDYSKDPFFVKKKEEAIAFLKKAGFPKDWENNEK